MPTSVKGGDKCAHGHLRALHGYIGPGGYWRCRRCARDSHRIYRRTRQKAA